MKLWLIRGQCLQKFLFFSDYKLIQDDTSSQTSMRDLKEEDLHFKMAYELNDEKNETIRFDCDKWVQVFLSAYFLLLWQWINFVIINRIENAKRLKIAYYVAQSSEVCCKTFNLQLQIIFNLPCIPKRISKKLICFYSIYFLFLALSLLKTMISFNPV